MRFIRRIESNRFRMSCCFPSLFFSAEVRAAQERFCATKACATRSLFYQYLPPPLHYHSHPVALPQLPHCIYHSRTTPLRYLTIDSIISRLHYHSRPYSHCHRCCHSSNTALCCTALRRSYGLAPLLRPCAAAPPRPCLCRGIPGTGMSGTR